jgi:glyoxylase I family protein
MVDQPLAEIRRLEELLLRPEVRRSPKALSELISDDFVEIGSSGRPSTKREVIDALRGELIKRQSLADFRGTMLSPSSALVNYRTVTEGGPQASTKESLRSSIWERRGGRWQIVFHEGMPIERPNRS